MLRSSRMADVDEHILAEPLVAPHEPIDKPEQEEQPSEQEQAAPTNADIDESNEYVEGAYLNSFANAIKKNSDLFDSDSNAMTLLDHHVLTWFFSQANPMARFAAGRSKLVLRKPKNKLPPLRRRDRPGSASQASHVPPAHRTKVLLNCLHGLHNHHRFHLIAADFLLLAASISCSSDAVELQQRQSLRKSKHLPSAPSNKSEPNCRKRVHVCCASKTSSR
jgi:hypothetical protein